MKTSILVVASGLLLAACFHDQRMGALPANSQREAGSVMLSPVAAYHWDEVKKSLQPGFALDASSALNSVLPVTAVRTRAVLDALGASLEVGLPTASEVVTTTKTYDASGNLITTGPDGNPAVVKTETETENKQQLPGEASAPFAETPTVPSFSPTPSVLGQDAILRYKAATTLLQEVRFLNSYLENVVVPQGFEPYLVRLQLAVLPNMRDQPFDVFTDIFLFDDLQDFDTGRMLEGAKSDGGSPIEKSRSLYTYDLEPITDKDGNEFRAFEDRDFELPRVLPLLVTDNLERRNERQTDQELLRFLGSLTATIKGVGASASVDKVLEKIEELQVDDLNSLFTVSQIAVNGIRLRLGARNDGGADRFEMIPRTHNVTLLVMAPKNVVETISRLRAVAYTRMRHADTGKELEIGEDGELKTKLQELANRYGVQVCTRNGDTDCETETVRNSEGRDYTRELQGGALLQALIERYVEVGDFNKFSSALESYGVKTNRDLQDLWAELARTIPFQPWSQIIVELPRRGEPKPTEASFTFAGEQPSSFIITSKQATVVRVPVTAPFWVERSKVYLEAEDTKQTIPDLKTLVIVPNAVAVNGGFLQASFPALPQVKEGLEGRRLYVEIEKVNESTGKKVMDGKHFILTPLVAKESKESSPVNLATGVETLLVTGGGASIAVQITGQLQAGAKAGLTVSNGQVVGASGGGVALDAKTGLVVISASPTVAVLTLTNVDPARDVVMRATSLKSGASLPVLDATVAPSKLEIRARSERQLPPST